MQKIAVVHWSDPKSYNEPHVLIAIPWILALGANDPVIGTPFQQSRLLPVILPGLASLSFNTQVMILSEFFWVLQPCLCFCRWVLPLHNHTLWHVAMRLGNRVGA